MSTCWGSLFFIHFVLSRTISNSGFVISSVYKCFSYVKLPNETNERCYFTKIIIYYVRKSLYVQNVLIYLLLSFIYYNNHPHTDFWWIFSSVTKYHTCNTSFKYKIYVSVFCLYTWLSIFFDKPCRHSSF